MVDVQRVPDSDFEAVYRMLCGRVGQRDRDDVRAWFRDEPDLFRGAYDDGALVGFAAGRTWTAAGRDWRPDSVELVGIAVDDDYTRNGVGSRLLEAFESAAAAAGFDRVTLGSAGGYVDEFYLANGYEPESVLVRLHPEDVPGDVHDLGFEILRERTDDGVRKFYVAPGGYDPERVDAVREAFGDPQAIYVMETFL